MPVYQVQDPATGRKLKLTGDTPPTDAELDEIFANLPAAEPAKEAPAKQPGFDMSRVATPSEMAAQAGIANVAAIKDEAAAKMAQMQETPGGRAALQMSEIYSPTQQFARAYDSGTKTVQRGVGAGGEVGSGEQMMMDALRAKNPIMTPIAETLGESVPFLGPSIAVGGPSSLIVRIAGQSAVGATQGGVLASGKGEDVPTGAVAGGLIGAGGEIGTSIINNVGRRLIQRLGGTPSEAVIDAAGKPTQELEAAMAASGTSFDDILKAAEQEPVSQAADIPAEQAARNAQRQQAFERMGVPFTEAERTRDKSLFNLQQDRSRQQGPVSELIGDREYQLAQQTADQIKNTGGDAANASLSPVNVVVNRSIKLDNAVTDAYRAARDAAPDAKNVRFDEASSVLRKFAPDNELSNGVISSLNGALEQSGALKNFKPSGRVSADSAEKIRQHANSIFQSTNDRGRAIIRQFKDALDNDVERAVGTDLFKDARKAKFDFERGLDREKLHKFDERDVNIVRDILNNKLTPEDIEKGTLIKKGSKYQASDLSTLKKYLHAGVDDYEQGAQAWNDIRAQALQEIADKAFKGAVTEQGSQSLSRAGLESVLKNGIGRDKFNVLFTPGEQKFLFNLAEVSRYKEPPPGTFMGSGPSSPAIEAAVKKIESKAEQLMFGIKVPIVSKVKGALSEKKLLQINDDLANIERERLQEQLRIPAAILTWATSTTAQSKTKKEE